MLPFSLNYELFICYHRDISFCLSNSSDVKMERDEVASTHCSTKQEV